MRQIRQVVEARIRYPGPVQSEMSKGCEGMQTGEAAVCNGAVILDVEPFEADQVRDMVEAIVVGKGIAEP